MVASLKPEVLTLMIILLLIVSKNFSNPMHLIWQRESNRKGPTSSSEQEGPKTPDPKVNSLIFYLFFCSSLSILFKLVTNFFFLLK